MRQVKAVVLETGPKYTIVLTRQGKFVQVKTLPHYQVGCEIECPVVPAVTPWIKAVSVAAVLMLFVSIGSLALAFATPYSYVSIDINPSVEMAVNRFDYIIDVKSLNPDGDAIVSRESLLYKPLQDGLGIVLERLNQEGYLPAGSQSTLVLTFVSEDQKKVDRFDQVVGEAVRQKLQDESKVDIYVLHTDLETHAEAEKHNLSSGRFLLIQELQKATRQDLNPGVLKEVPIGEIVKMVKEKHPESDGDGRGLNRQGLLKQVRPKMQQGQERQDSQQWIQQMQERENQWQGQEREDRKEGRKGKDNHQVPEWQEGRPRVERLENRERQEQQDHERKQERQDNRREREREDGKQSRESKEKREVTERQESREKGEWPENRRKQEQQDHERKQEQQDHERGQEGQDSRKGHEQEDSRPKQGRHETGFSKGGAGKML